METLYTNLTKVMLNQELIELLYAARVHATVIVRTCNIDSEIIKK